MPWNSKIRGIRLLIANQIRTIFYCFVDWSRCWWYMHLAFVGQSTIRNGTLHDIPRVQYIQSYIGSLLDAIRYAFQKPRYCVDIGQVIVISCLICSRRCVTWGLLMMSSCSPIMSYMMFWSSLSVLLYNCWIGQRNGSNTRGYFTWSFLDVFELLDGYESGYGLYYVDLDDNHLKRYPKLSAQWYSSFLKGSNTSLHQVIEITINTSCLSQSQFSQ